MGGLPGTFKIKSTNPDADVLFYPFTTERTSVVDFEDPSAIDTTEISAYDSLLSINTSKPKGAAGSFSVTLAPTRNWKGTLQPGCWCLIYMSDKTLTPLKDRTSTLEDGLKMIGIVKSVNRIERTNPTTGLRTVRYQVSGVDFHAVFDAQQYLNVHLGQLSKKGGQSSYNTFFLGYGKRFASLQRPDELVQNLIDVLLGRPAFLADIKGDEPIRNFKISARAGSPFKVPKQMAKRVLGYRESGAAGNLFTGMVTFFLQRNLLGKIVQKPEIMGIHTTWSILESYANKLLNELYTDMLPVNLSGAVRTLPSLVFRAIPFTSEGFKESSPVLEKSPTIKFSEAVPREQLVNGKATVVPRQIPARARGQAFTANPKQKRPELNDGVHFFISREIPENEILGMRHGKSDNERFNLFLVSPNLSLLGGIGEVAIISNLISQKNRRRPLDAISDLTSITRYGLRPYVAQSNYVDKSYADLLAINRVVKDLWEPAHLYESGTVSLVGLAEHIPVGTNIKFIERGWVAHVEQVSHTYQVDEATWKKTYRTNLSFVRLQKDNGEPIDLVENQEDKEKLTLAPWDRGASFSSLKKQEEIQLPASNEPTNPFGNIV